jgi:hypothetical protein
MVRSTAVRYPPWEVSVKAVADLNPAAAFSCNAGCVNLGLERLSLFSIISLGAESCEERDSPDNICR